MRIRMHIRQNQIQCTSNAHCSRSHYFLKFTGNGLVHNNDCTTGVQAKSYADTVVCCSVLICYSTALSCTLSIEGITEGIVDDWEDMQRKNGYCFARNVFAGKTTNPSVLQPTAAIDTNIALDTCISDTTDSCSCWAHDSHYAIVR